MATTVLQNQVARIFASKGPRAKLLALGYVAANDSRGVGQAVGF
jgi:hypothetical protein